MSRIWPTFGRFTAEVGPNWSRLRCIEPSNSKRPQILAQSAGAAIRVVLQALPADSSAPPCTLGAAQDFSTPLSSKPGLPCGIPGPGSFHILRAARNYLAYNLYEQALKLVEKTSFPESRPNAQYARYLLYIGQIKAPAASMFLGSIRAQTASFPGSWHYACIGSMAPHLPHARSAIAPLVLVVGRATHPECRVAA